MILHSQIFGSGTPFLILHGFLGMSDNWKTLGKKFAELGYEVHLVDQRNHGRSFHDTQFSYELMAKDVHAYCQSKKIQECVLLGHSMGGKTAMQFATIYLAMVKKLIVADITPKEYPQHHQDILKGLASLDFDRITSREEADETLAQYIPEIGTRMFLLKNLYWIEKGTLGLRMNLPILSEKISEVGKPLAADASFEGPTLFLKGEKSDYIIQGDEIIIKHHFPQARIQTVTKAGHWLHAENPNEFYQYVSNFL